MHFFLSFNKSSTRIRISTLLNFPDVFIIKYTARENLSTVKMIYHLQHSIYKNFRYIFILYNIIKKYIKKIIRCNMLTFFLIKTLISIVILQLLLQLFYIVIYNYAFYL